MLGYQRAEYTLDVDSIIEINSIDVQQIIEAVGEKLGLSPNWLNDQSSTVSLPNGVMTRVTPFTRWKSIRTSIVCRADLIKMKASAFSIRRDHTNKDWEDLVLLKPTNEEMSDAIRFLKISNCPPENASEKILADFEETIYDLKKFIK